MNIKGKKISQLNQIQTSSMDGSEFTIIESGSTTGHVSVRDLQTYLGKDFLFREEGFNYIAHDDIAMNGQFIGGLADGRYDTHATNVRQLATAELRQFEAQVTYYVNSGSIDIQSDKKFFITFPDNTRQTVTSTNLETYSVSEGVLVLTWALEKPEQLILDGSVIQRQLGGYGLNNLHEFDLKNSAIPFFYMTDEDSGYSELGRKYGFASEINGPVDLSGNTQMTICNITDTRPNSLNITGCLALEELHIRGSDLQNDPINGNNDLSAYINMIQFNAESCGLTSIILPVSMENVTLYQNKIRNPNFSSNVNIQFLNIHDNEVETFTMTNTSVISIICLDNPNMTTFNVSNNLNLEDVNLERSSFTGGGTMSFNNCNFDADALNSIMNSILEGDATLDFSNNPGSADCDVSIAESKGYTVIR